MQQYDMTFRSMTAAQQAQWELSRAGVAARLLRAPKQSAMMGCGYALRMGAEHVQRAVLALRQAGLPFERLYPVGEGGDFREGGL